MRIGIPPLAGAAALAAALGALGVGAAAPANGQTLAGSVVLAGWHEHVPGARVQLLSADMAVVAAVESDRDGRFLFRTVTPGDYYLQATYRQRSSAVRGPVRVPDLRDDTVAAPRLALPSELYQRARACLGQVLEAPDSAGEASDRPLSGVLAGVAYEESTVTPIPGARVSLAWKDADGVQRRSDMRTDAAGRFVFCDVAARVPVTVELDVLGAVAAHHEGVRVQPGALARMDLSAQLGLDSRIRVLSSIVEENPDSMATLQGQLVDASTEAPIPGASVNVEGTGLATVTDEDGRFRIAGVPAGQVAFAVERLGYDWRSEYVAVEAGATVVLELRAAPTAIDLETVVVRVSTPEMRMARAATQAPRVMAGLRLLRAEERAASLVDVIRLFPSLQIRTGQFETELGIERGVCIESSRALMRYVIPEKQTPLPWCEMIAIIIDGVATFRGTEMINAMRLPEIESIEFLPPTGALQYGERAALNGALVIWTRGRGPHRDPSRWSGRGR